MSEQAHVCLSGTVQVQDRGVAEEDAVMVLDSTAAISSHEPVKMAVCAGNYLAAVKREESEPF